MGFELRILCSKGELQLTYDILNYTLKLFYELFFNIFVAQLPGIKV